MWVYFIHLFHTKRVIQGKREIGDFREIGSVLSAFEYWADMAPNETQFNYLQKIYRAFYFQTNFWNMWKTDLTELSVFMFST